GRESSRTGLQTTYGRSARQRRQQSASVDDQELRVAREGSNPYGPEDSQPVKAMAGNPTLWFIVYGIVIPVIVLGVSLWTGWGGLLLVFGVLVWMGIAVAMLSPHERR
ncbi:MAG TPA: hypothetical protein VJN63_00295, partial [Thermoplasmata archaeon]|nr:hypothetical protein [Thermoplasmata archaeon]